MLPFPHPPVTLPACPEDFGKIAIFDGVSCYGLFGHPIESVKFLTPPNSQLLPAKVPAGVVPFFQRVLYSLKRHWGIFVKSHVLRDVFLNYGRFVVVEL